MQVDGPLPNKVASKIWGLRPENNMLRLQVDMQYLVLVPSGVWMSLIVAGPPVSSKVSWHWQLIQQHPYSTGNSPSKKPTPMATEDPPATIPLWHWKFPQQCTIPILH